MSVNRNTQFINHAGLLEFLDLTHGTDDLYLSHCGMQQCIPNHYYGKIARPEYHLHFILSGKGVFEFEQASYHLSRGQMFLIPANATHYAYRADARHPWLYAWVSFSGTKAEYYLNQAGFLSNSVIRTCEIPPEEFTSFIYKMLDANQLTVENELARTGLLFELISLIIQTKSYTSSHQQYDYSSETYVKHALHYIHFNYNTNIQVQDIVNYIGINRSYFSSIFKQELSLSPKDYLQQYRINRAKQLLLETSDSITDIAYSVGFKDSSTFSKAFKVVTGKSPRHYRLECSPSSL